MNSSLYCEISLVYIYFDIEQVLLATPDLTTKSTKTKLTPPSSSRGKLDLTGVSPPKKRKSSSAEKVVPLHQRLRDEGRISKGLSLIF